MSHFEQIESLFFELISISDLSESEILEVQSFVDVGEYGLALETLVDICLEENKRVSDNVLTQIEQLAVKMAIPPLPLITKLRGAL